MKKETFEYFKDFDIGCTCPNKFAMLPNGEKKHYRITILNTLNTECFLPTPIKEARLLPDGIDDFIGKPVYIYCRSQTFIVNTVMFKTVNVM